MTVYKDTLVPIPPHSYVQKAGGLFYNYTYTSFYRNEQGNSRNKSRITGIRPGRDSDQMHPNDNYYALMKMPRKRKESSVINIGFTAVTEAAFDDLGLLDVLTQAVGKKRAVQIRSVCAYMVKEGCIMSYIDHFTQEEYFRHVDEVLSSQMVSDIFMDLTEDEMNDFYAEWIPKKNSEHYICYDVTSISTYSKMIHEAEYGYNRDHDDLPQMNLGLFTSEENKYPLYLARYNGSVNDASNLVHACRNARSAGLDGKFKIVMDGGFFDEKKLNTLHEEEIVFAVGMPAYLDITKKYIDDYGDGLFSPRYYVGHEGTYGKMIEDQEIFGIRGRVFLGLCTEASSMLNEDLDDKIERYMEEMESIVKYTTVTKHKKYTGLFDFHEVEGSKGYTYERNEEKILDARKRFGYFAVFTTDQHATAQNIIDAYRDKDFDEKQFYELKQYMDARRPRVHSQSAFDGKYSILVIALIMRTWLKEKLGSYKKAHHLTLKRIMIKLSDIRMFVDDDEIRLLKSLTAEQRDILALCGIDHEQLEMQYREALLDQQN